MTIDELKQLKESEDNVEFKSARNNYPVKGGKRSDPKDRRKCITGYVIALCNEGGGKLVLGMADKYPHEVVGSTVAEGLEGALEDEIYNETGIRVNNKPLYDQDNKRVLIINVPCRPIGKIMKFEGVGLMRIGDSLREMSDEETYKILSEREPDFSAKICQDIALSDIDEKAIEHYKKQYSAKSKNQSFLTLNSRQVLSDLDLLKDNKLTYAALILFGKEKSIKNHLPQSSIFLEYRSDEASITFNTRDYFIGPLILTVERLWEKINARNGKVQIQQGIYRYEVPQLNQEVTREGILNALTHRDYSMNSEVLIKQYPSKLIITNPGSFPHGVTIDNILTVNSTPRNRLIADIFLKAGLVERSGQGVDKIFYQCIAEAKDLPNYTDSDSFKVTLILSTLVRDPAFVLFINDYQSKSNNKKLGIMEILTLNQIRERQTRDEMDEAIVRDLISFGLVEKIGKTSNLRYILSKNYFRFTDQRGKYSIQLDLSEERILFVIIDHLKNFKTAKMNDLIVLFDNKLTRSQILYRLKKFLKNRILEKTGTRKSATYSISKGYVESEEILEKAVKIGMEQMIKDAKKSIEQEKEEE